jgi:acetolactate synthase-1/2/3 large subunit
VNTPHQYNGANALLEYLTLQETDFVFCAPIAAWAPFWEALALRKEQGGSGPRYLNCRHEVLAVGLAAGYYKATRRAQSVLLATGLGVLNAGMALRNALQEHVGLVAIAVDAQTYGEFPEFDPGAEWPSLLVDLPGPAREGEHCVSWSCEIKTPGDLNSQLRRAFYFAESVPRGPTLLQVPFDILMAPASKPPLPRLSPATMIAPAETADQVAEMLCRAESPIIVTEAAGRVPEAMSALVDLAEALSAPVFEFWMPAYLNFPRHHPLHGRDSYVPGGVDAVLPQTDCVLAVDCSSPWHPPLTEMNPNVQVIAMAEDPLRPRLPYQGYRTDFTVPGDVNMNLQNLLTQVKKRAQPQPARFKRWSEYNAKVRADDRRSDAEAIRQQNELVHPALLMQALNRTMPERSVVVDEVVSHLPAMLEYLFENKSFDHIRGMHGGLGGGLPNALGVKLARPDELVVALIGDGSFNFNPIPACLGLAQQYSIPVFIVICNNQGYESQKFDVCKFFPNGAAVRNNDFYGEVIEPTPDYWKLAEIWGGYGERVADPKDLDSAIGRCINAVNRGTFALLDVLTS